MKTGTVRQLMDHYGGQAPGFDGLRLILAFTVMFWHAAHICGFDNVDVPEAGKALLRGILPMFFFLGGFLVTGSALRLKLVTPFLTFRLLRIVPALMVEVTLSAIVLGAFATTLPLVDYFTHGDFYRYFLNILGSVHFYLPGVFQDSPRHYVNVNLWMLPYELYTYMIMAALIVSGVIFNKKIFLGVFSLATFFLLVMMVVKLNFGQGSVVFIEPWLFVYAFFLGTFVYLYADKIKVSLPLMALSVVGMVFFVVPYMTFIGVLAACYLTLCIGFIDMRGLPLIKRGDYSYGVYLYGYPIEQALWHFVPALRHWELLFAVALPTTLLFAVISWHLIEKPVLMLKNKIGKKKVVVAAG